MITGCGVDIVSIKRFLELVENERFLERFFHPDEVAYICRNKKRATESLAVRFAAKEAFGKALGTGLSGLQLKEICVRRTSSGKPEMHLYGAAEKKLKLNGASRIHLSLSHEKEYAIAQVILEKI